MAHATEILWRVHVFRNGEWKLWSGSSGDLRLDCPERSNHAERTQRRESELLASLGRIVRLSYCGSAIDHYNLHLMA